MSQFVGRYGWLLYIFRYHFCFQIQPEHLLELQVIEA